MWRVGLVLVLCGCGDSDMASPTVDGIDVSRSEFYAPVICNPQADSCTRNEARLSPVEPGAVMWFEAAVVNDDITLSNVQLVPMDEVHRSALYVETWRPLGTSPLATARLAMPIDATTTTPLPSVHLAFPTYPANAGLRFRFE